MIVETSAFLAILLQEAEANTFSILIKKSSSKKMSAANYLEACIVALRGNPNAFQEVDSLISLLSINIMPVSTNQMIIARQAYNQYGKGRHNAALNYGDCFSYALSKEENEPLLFKGNDFSQTDIIPAI